MSSYMPNPTQQRNLNPIITLKDFSLDAAGPPDSKLDSQHHKPSQTHISLLALDKSNDDLKNRIVEAQQTIERSTDNNMSSLRVDVGSVMEVNRQAMYRFESDYNNYAEDDEATTSVKKNSTKDVDNTSAFVIVGLLKPNEAEYVIKTAQPHMRPLDTLYAQRTRKADRAMIRSPKVAAQLYQRILPHLRKEDYSDRTPLCFGMDGVWVPYGLNECLKIFRYNEKGRFVEHRDGPWVPRQDQCSMYTVVVYLNENFAGGETQLLGSCDYCSPQGRRSSYRSEYLSVSPVTGMALLFNHDCWHAAGSIEVGTKWILRTELIFQRVHSFYVDKNAFATDKEYAETRALYDASMKASEEGDKEQFFTKYQEVVRRQRTAMLSDAACRKPRLLPRLGFEEFSVVLSYLTDNDIRALLCVNRKTYAAVVQAPYWQDRWENNVRVVSGEAPAVLKSHEDAIIASMSTFKDKLSGQENKDNSQEGGSNIHLDYFSLVRQRLWMRTQFIPTGLILLDSGAMMTIPDDSPEIFDRTLIRNHEYRHASRPTFTRVFEKGSSKTYLPWQISGVGELEFDTKNGRSFSIHRCEQYYGGWRYAYPYHMNQPHGESLTMSDDPANVEDPRSVVAPLSGAVEWSVLSVPIEELISTTHCPIVVVVHPAWFFGRNKWFLGAIQAQAALDALFHLCRVPAVGFCHPAVCAVIGYLAAFSTTDRSMLKEQLVVALRYGRDENAVSYTYTVALSNFNVEPSTKNSLPDLKFIDAISNSTVDAPDTFILGEVLAYGVETIIASPSLRDVFIYRY